MAEMPAEQVRESFRLAAAVVRHLRDDPLLPEELLPPGWPGPALRTAYDRYEAAFQAALRPVLRGTPR
jgi:phenylacetic acid degradation operon negative regulatory protein